MNKLIFIIAMIIAFLTQSIITQSGTFQLIYGPDKLSYQATGKIAFRQIFNSPSSSGTNLIHFPYRDNYKIADQFGNVRTYNAFSTSLSTNL